MSEGEIKTASQILQEDATKELIKDLEKQDKKIIELSIGGGFLKDIGLVYEPIGDYNYLIKIKDYKKLIKAEHKGVVECSLCHAIITTTREMIRCSCGQRLNVTLEWILDIFNSNKVRFIFLEEPLKRIPYITPRIEIINEWIENGLFNEKGEQISSKEVFNILKQYFKGFFDLPMERSYDLLGLAVMQSWIQPILDVVFYLAITGETGSGKTALLEAITKVTRHGLITNNISTSGVARVTEAFELSLGIDEIDEQKSKDDDLGGILRQGYRRGQYFIRMAPNSHQPEFFKVFGFKAFTYRSGIADDLLNRSIDVPISMTKEKNLPVINLYQNKFSPFEICFFWYFDNIAEIYLSSPSFNNILLSISSSIVNNVNIVNKVYIVNNNNNNTSLDNKIEGGRGVGVQGVNNLYSIYNKPNFIARTGILPQIPYLKEFEAFISKHEIFGRNVEIAYLIFIISIILKIDINNLLMETIEQKQQMENVSQDEGWIGLLKEVLLDCYNDSEKKDGISYVTYRKGINKYIQRMRDVYDNVPSQFQIRKLLRQLGFVDGINRKLLRAGVKNKPALCLIYDTYVKEKLGIDIEEEKENEVLIVKIVDKKIDKSEEEDMKSFLKKMEEL